MTRFNVRFAHSLSSSALALSPDWLWGRVALFEDYCLSSVISQTARPDSWIIMFDENTPPELRERAASWRAAIGIIRPAYMGPFDVPVAVDAVMLHGRVDRNWLVTTRLDSDDALHPRFCEVVRENVVEGRREFLNITRGLIVANGKCYRKSMPANPFISFSEPTMNARTVWAEQHGLLHQVAPVRQLRLRDGWVQIVHGGNLSNIVRGVRIPSGWVSRSCLPPKIAAELRRDGWVELITDNTLGLWRRWLPAIRNLLRRVFSK